MNVRKDRQSSIVALIEQESISTQDELMQRLKENGYEVTQATISRDIKELKLIKKVGPDGKSIYSVNGSASVGTTAKYNSILEGAIISVDYAINMCVIKTHAGMANAACASFDSMNLEGVLGTIAGDDTIFVLCSDEANAASVTSQIKKLIQA